MTAPTDAVTEMARLRAGYFDRLSDHEAQGSKATEDATLTAGHQFMAALRRNRAAILADPDAFRSGVDHE